MVLNLEDISKLFKLLSSIRRKYPKKVAMGFDRTYCSFLSIYVEDPIIYCDPKFIEIRDFARRTHGKHFRDKGIQLIFVRKVKPKAIK